MTRPRSREPGDHPPWPVAAASVWEAGEDGAPPTIDVSRAVGWLFTDGAWSKAIEDDDVMRCIERIQRLSLERGTWQWQVLPEGQDPKGD